MENIVILGYGGVGRFVLHAINEINLISPRWQVLGFLDDESSNNQTAIEGVPVLGTSDWLIENPNVAVILAIADPVIKSNILNKLNKYGCNNFPVLIHPGTWIAENVSIGDGSIIYPGARINVSSNIGRFVTINMNCSIGHDATIEDFSFIAPNVSIGGNTRVGKGTSLGIGSSVIQSIAIGAWSTVGAGSVVIKDVLAKHRVAGNPAKPID
jgi:sugar O-acyltransferase (sialic acid O-acetyltransferase NeuD family)